MRRIFIDKRVVEMSKKYATNLFNKRQGGFKKPVANLIELEDYLRTVCHKPNYADYVLMIKNKYSIINNVRPQYFDSLHTRYFNTLSEADLKTKIQKQAGYSFKTKALYELIVDAMRYDAIREKDFLPYVHELGIKTCVYCNTQLAITIDNNDGTFSGKYELDHFYPKSKYPFLCTSFFNLQPSCSHCNKAKSGNETLFGLYTIKYSDIVPFKFEIIRRSIIRYMLTQNSNDLKIDFKSPDALLKKNHEDTFHITKLYETQKDVVEEIIWKYKIYTSSYKKSLSQSFSTLFPRSTDFNRFILGNYDKPNQVHKRPLSLLVQDIARQLGLI